MINGKSYPHTERAVLKAGQRYRLVMKNTSMDDHPVHLHRHSFEVRRVVGAEMRGIDEGCGAGAGEETSGGGVYGE